MQRILALQRIGGITVAIIEADMDDMKDATPVARSASWSAWFSCVRTVPKDEHLVEHDGNVKLYTATDIGFRRRPRLRCFPRKAAVTLQ